MGSDSSWDSSEDRVDGRPHRKTVASGSGTYHVSENCPKGPRTQIIGF